MSEIKKTLEQWSHQGKKKWEGTSMQIRNLKLTCAEPFKEYFQTLKKIISDSAAFEVLISTDIKTTKYTHPQLKKMQNQYYADLEPLPSIAYDTCFGNPAYSEKSFGKKMGKLLCMLYSEFRRYRTLLIQKRYSDLANLNDLFLQLYTLASDNKTKAKDWHKIIVKSLLSEIPMHQLFNLYWRFSPEQDYYKNIILKADLSNPNYLYRYGIYISKYDVKMAEYMQKYPEKELKQLSKYIVKSYQDGFERGLRSYNIKKYVNLILPAGLERLGRMLVADLRKIGLEAIIPQPVTQSINRQFDYDHRFDMALYYDQKFVDKVLPAYEKAAKLMKDVLKLQAGPVVVELFGEVPFEPADKPSALRLSSEQLRLRRIAQNKITQIFFKYYIQQETSFCIIAFPSPEIGSKFKQIFADTVKLNMLDSLHYAEIQQKIIDVLDTADYVHVKGKRGNETDIMVKLHTIKNPGKETNFENCVADVNIPVGEVFTSPLLKGTNGTLHVKEVYLRNLLYHNLKLTFKDGMISSYSCTNFKTKKENLKYIEENLLMPHKTLPIGEFAIGTNTLAYKIALKYNIMGLLPILILEKMGPHFAVGDTCYTREEDFDHFNFFDGKKLIAVDNEKTALRKTDPMNAYTQVHTDITLPYDMLQSISAVRKDGKRIDIIKNGLFAVPGTEELNKPLKELTK